MTFAEVETSARIQAHKLVLENMAKKEKGKTTDEYIEELEAMIEKANDGEPFAPWLLPQIRTTAMNMVILDKLQQSIEDEDSLTMSTTGSMGQQKIDVNPLLGQYYKAQQVLMNQFEALGLTAKRRQSGDSQDKNDDMMVALLNEAKK